MKAPRLSSCAASSTRRCAIYTRVSTDNGLEQEFNSLHAQREACEAYIKSQAHEAWRLIPERFDDGGFSGASLARPGLLEILDLVDRGKVDIIVVYKVDRLTRSLADFAKLVEKFDARAASFVSVTQSFNTTSSMGRLTLNMRLSFAQFEREVTGERIRDKIAASKKRGLWLGGGLPLGYRVEDRRLIVEQEEATTVKLIFDLYLECGSLLGLLTELRRRGVATRRRSLSTGQTIGGIPFTRGPLNYLLKNRIYVGEIRHRDKSYPGEHEAIIDPTTFEAVQTLLKQNGRAKEPKRYGSAALLKDLLFDDRGFRMTPSSAKKQGLRYRYYVSRALIEGATDHAGSLTRVAAPALEAAVLEALAPLVEQSSSDDTACPASIEPDDPGLLLNMVERVIVSRGRFTLVFASDERDRLQRDRLDIAWSPRPTRPKREVLESNEPNARAMASEQRSTLIAAIARGRFWLHELTAGRTDIDAIALREKRSQRTVQNTISLAFLSPKIVQGAIHGSLPKGVSMSRLFDLPMEWELQHKALGID